MIEASSGIRTWWRHWNFRISCCSPRRLCILLKPEKNPEELTRERTSRVHLLLLISSTPVESLLPWFNCLIRPDWWARLLEAFGWSNKVADGTTLEEAHFELPGPRNGQSGLGIPASDWHDSGWSRLSHYPAQNQILLKVFSHYIVEATCGSPANNFSGLSIWLVEQLILNWKSTIVCSSRIMKW